MEKEFKITVIIPIYNTEKYIEEAIESVINQDFGFEENIQIILVNDGSTDNSKNICLAFKNKYPNNILYIEQNNEGVSSARNAGIEYAKGKYINFLDSDDKWQVDAFSKAYEMFENNKEIDVVSVRQKHFGQWKLYTDLDFKYTSDRIINVMEEYSCIQLSVTSSFIRTSIMKEKRFDEKVKYGEDAKLLYEIILEKEQYGCIASSIHYYRKRFEGDSAIQKSTEDLSWYFDTTERVYKYLIELSLKKYGAVIPYVQYYIMYDLQWRLTSKVSNKLDKSQLMKYNSILISLLITVDDNIINEMKYYPAELKEYAINLKKRFIN